MDSRFITSLCSAFLAYAAVSIAIADEALTGRELAHSYDYGNCLACHSVPTDKTAVTRANIAPPLFDIKSRFPDKDALFDQIWDARRINPETIMPPFGENHILSEHQINKIIEYLYTL